LERIIRGSDRIDTQHRGSCPSVCHKRGQTPLVSLEMSNRILFFMFGAATFLAGWLFGFTFDHVTNWIGWLIP